MYSARQTRDQPSSASCAVEHVGGYLYRPIPSLLYCCTAVLLLYQTRCNEQTLAGSREDDHNWPEPDRVGRQELEVKLGKEHISFTVRTHSFHLAHRGFHGGFAWHGSLVTF